MEDFASADGEHVEEQHGLAVVWEGPGPFMVPRLLKSLSGKPVVQAALGWSHTLLLTRDGAVYSFGQQPWQDQAYVFAQEPRREMGLAGVEVVYIAAGARHSGAVGSLGDVYMWGSNLHGQCAVRDTEEVQGPTLVAFEPNRDPDASGAAVQPSASPRNCAGSRGRLHVSLLACGHTHTLAWSQTSDEMWGWGNSSQLCHAATADPPAASASRIQYQPRRIEHFVGVKVRQLVCGALHNLALVEVLHENHAPGLAQPPAAQPVLSRNVTAGSDNFTASGEWMSLTEDALEGISIRIEERAKEDHKNSNRSDRGMRLKTFVSDDLSSSFEDSFKMNDLKIDTNIWLSDDDDLNIEKNIHEPLHNVNPKKVNVADVDEADQEVSEVGKVAVMRCVRHLSQKKKVSPAVAPANSVFAFDSEALDSSTEHFLSSDSVSEKQMSPVYEHIRRFRRRSTRRKETMGRQPEVPRSQSLKDRGMNVLQVTPDNPAARPAIPAECAAASRTGAQAEECRNSTSIDTNQLGHNRNTKEFKPELDHGFAAGGGAASAGESPPSATSTTVNWEGGWQTTSTQPRRQRLEVWSWGDGQDGQLGLGDTLSRLMPQCIQSLVGEEIIKLAAGDFHSLALTSTSKVYSWGRNRSGQLGHDKLRCLTPHLLETLPAGEVLDVAAAEEHSLFAINREDSYDSRVYYCSRLAGHGSGADEMQGPPIVHLPLPNQKLQVTQVQAGGEQSLVLALQTAPPPYSQLLHEFFKSERDYVQVLGRMKDVVFHPLLQEGGLDRTLPPAMATPVQLLLSRFSSLVSMLENALSAMASSLKASARPGTSEVSSSSPQPMTSSPLGRSTSATEDPFAGHVHIRSVHLVTEQTAIQDAYSEYFAALTNLLVIRGLESINSNSSYYRQQEKKVWELAELMETLGSSQGVVETLYCILMAPASHMQNYSMFATCLLTCFPMESPQYEWAKAVSLKWDTFYNDVKNLIEQAYSTREFWLHKTSKSLENLCVPTRRVIKDSISLPLSPVKTSRFATHRYILFNDIFLHTKGATQTVYCVSTIWVETLNDNNQNVYGLRVYTPEEELHLASSTALNRDTWRDTFERVIRESIGQPSIGGTSSLLSLASRKGSLLCAGQGSPALSRNESLGSVGQPSPANSRRGSLLSLGHSSTASGSSPQDSPGHRGRGSLSLRTDCGYTFRKLPQLRGAHYYGQWCDGKPHGWGRMTWPDGRTYIGNFKFGSEHGYGKYTVVNASTGKKEKYCGDWREGKINGYGLYKHTDGEVYEGYLMGGVRHGHGMLLSSKGEHAGGVYVGHWASGKRAGYGVYENVSRGEKYMGTWEDDTRHGNGLCITQHGIVYQGTFIRNKMGSGILMTDDDTFFEGEFSDERILNGKGVLTMPNGDYIEGVFTGEWGSGIKISGTFQTAPPSDSVDYGVPQPPNGRVLSLAVPARDKWSGIFQECWAQMGCATPGNRDLHRAWENIVMSYTMDRTHNSSIMTEEPQSDGEENSILQTVPLYQQGKMMTLQDYKAMQAYLKMAFGSLQHPLGRLLDMLVTAFRATYVGIGSDRRLLSTALAEISYYVERIFAIIQFLFPDLPEEESRVVELNSSDPDGNADEAWEVVTRNGLILPLLLPGLYPQLLALYQLQDEESVTCYWANLTYLNRQPDQALLRYLEANPKLWPLSDAQQADKQMQEQKNQCFGKAVTCLKLISAKFTPREKLAVLGDTFRAITAAVEDARKQLCKWAMDDLIPVFMFVVLRARIRHLGAEVQLIEDLMDDHLRDGEQGIMLITLKACCYQIQRENSR
ncbi:ALS2 C-terminal-like protein isoform X2 [Lampetra fluviatilis]